MTKSKKSSGVKNAIKIVIFVLLFSLIFALLTDIFVVKYYYSVWNYTAKMNSYRNLPENTVDIAVFGSSHAYCSFVPTEITKCTGLNAYVLSTQQQPVCACYHYMVEAFKTQNPKYIVLECYSVGEWEGEIDDDVIYDAIDQIPLSLNKLEMIYNLTRGKDNVVPFYLTLLKFHTRWNELEVYDFHHNDNEDYDEYRGYVHIETVTPVSLPRSLTCDDITEINEADSYYLDRIIKLCAQHDSTLILAYTPYTVTEENLSKLNGIIDYAKDKGITFVNGWKDLDKIGLDETTDFCDKGHLNYSGAIKFTDYFCSEIFSQK